MQNQLTKIFVKFFCVEIWRFVVRSDLFGFFENVIGFFHFLFCQSYWRASVHPDFIALSNRSFSMAETSSSDNLEQLETMVKTYQ